jgi:hypothetical protein
VCVCYLYVCYIVHSVSVIVYSELHEEVGVLCEELRDLLMCVCVICMCVIYGIWYMVYGI